MCQLGIHRSLHWHIGILINLQIINRFFNTTEDFFDCTHTVNTNMFAFAYIIVCQRSCLVVVNIQSGFDCFQVVV